MNRSHLRKVIVITCGVAASALLTFYESSSTGFRGPAIRVVHYLYPPWRGDQNVLNKALNVYLATDFIFFFIVVSALYQLLSFFGKRLRGRNNK
jgi:hypothetical protein